MMHGRRLRETNSFNFQKRSEREMTLLGSPSFWEGRGDRTRLFFRPLRRGQAVEQVAQRS